MPNWCSNTLHIFVKVEDKANADFVSKMYDHALANTMLNFLKPLPANTPNELEWCVENWGTKWEVDVYGQDDYSDDTYYHFYLNFDSAWSPPLQALEVLKERGIDFKLAFQESGVGYYGVMTKDRLLEHTPEMDDSVDWADVYEIQKYFERLLSKQGYTQDDIETLIGLGLADSYVNEDYEKGGDK